MKISPGKRHWGRGRGSSRREASFAPPQGHCGQGWPLPAAVCDRTPARDAPPELGCPGSRSCRHGGVPTGLTWVCSSSTGSADNRVAQRLTLHRTVNVDCSGRPKTLRYTERCFLLKKIVYLFVLLYKDMLIKQLSSRAWGRHPNSQGQMPGPSWGHVRSQWHADDPPGALNGAKRGWDMVKGELHVVPPRRCADTEAQQE